MTGKTKIQLRPLTPTASKTARIVDQLLELARLGALEVGSKLPSERELAEQLGVSRTVVREALSALQLAGVLDRRVGEGTYVRSAQFSLSRAIPPTDEIEAGTSLIQVLEAREALDISVAKLAIENADEAAIAGLDEILNRMRLAIEKLDFRQYINLTLDFHIVVAAAAGNPYLEQTVSTLVETTRRYVWLLERNYDRKVAEKSLVIHRDIVEAIRARNLDAAIATVKRHYTDYPTLEFTKIHSRDPGSLDRDR